MRPERGRAPPRRHVEPTTRAGRRAPDSETPVWRGPRRRAEPRARRGPHRKSPPRPRLPVHLHTPGWQVARVSRVLAPGTRPPVGATLLEYLTWRRGGVFTGRGGEG